MSIYDKINNLTQEKWRYYKEMTFNVYEEAIVEPLNFIMSYFGCAGKNEFLYESLFDFYQTDNDEQKIRAVHTVNTFFFGLYLLEEIDYLKPHNNSFLAKDKNFIWAWFLCALYHDAFFNINQEIYPNYSYAKYSNGLIYDKSLVAEYFKKEKDINTSHNKKINFDHGIVAAEKMFYNYTNMINATLKQSNKQFKDFLNDEDFDYCGLKINKFTFLSMCKIAKIIACHNIFILNTNANEKERAKYINLPELIKGNETFRCMPDTKNKLEISSYEKLYFLLALVDTLEPSKRGIPLDEINVQVDKIKYGVYDLRITFSSDKGDQENYLSGISKLSDWLNFVGVYNTNKIIGIDFYNNKNHN